MHMLDDTSGRRAAVAPTLAVGLALAIALAGCPASPPPAASKRSRGAGAARAELALVNGRIFTARSDSELVAALAIGNGRVLAVGSRAAIAAHIGAGTRVVDLGGRFVAPGFHDAHMHLQSAGDALARLDLSGLRSLDDVLAKVRAAVAKRPAGAWIVGRGWDQTLWKGWHPAQKDARWPTRADLDRVAPRHPVALARIDGHVLWLNSAALARAGISAKSADPSGGTIVREGKSRQPSGILEEKATALVRIGEGGGVAAARQALLRALQRARRRGVTSVCELGSSLDALLALEREGKLTARVTLWTSLGSDLSAATARRAKLAAHAQARARAGGAALVRLGALKGFVDGTLGSRTAALLEPYADKPGSRGTLRQPPGVLEAQVLAASRAGFQIALHAIGDRAVRRALDTYAKLAPAARARLRHRVEHVQVIAPADVPRFAKLSVIASLQPCHLSTDQRWVEKRLGAARAAERGYRWRALASAGARIALGTDWPVEPVDPLRNLFAAITRRRVETPAVVGWHAEQALAFGQALRAYSAGSAYATHVEARRGTLAPGMDADLVVFDRDLWSAVAKSPRALLDARVSATLLAGKVVYGKLGR
ncbi:MAG: amidohydrolase [Myxococcales bacterium]|nr:amidohydrolase [Myxococcales bacterium]